MSKDRSVDGLKRADIDHAVNGLKAASGPRHRYTSFDYCYNYFRSRMERENDIERSCLTLGFYLASWGMFRGSSFLLQRSAKHFQPLIEYVGSLDDSIWLIDVDTYDTDNIDLIIQVFEDIRNLVIVDKNADLTLITKIMLGVFGFVPAFDNYFTNSFRAICEGQCGFRKFNAKSLGYIKEFYEANKPTVDKLSAETFTIDFATGRRTPLHYPKAKIVDMYGFYTGYLAESKSDKPSGDLKPQG